MGHAVLKKSIVTVLLMTIMIAFMAPVVFGDPVLNPDDYIPSKTGEGGQSTTIAKNIVGTIRIIGVVVSVVALMLIGIKYMIGSVEEKAEYKKALLPYVIGAVMLFAASALVQVLYDFGTNINW